jgi:hypothetical protein
MTQTLEQAGKEGSWIRISPNFEYLAENPDDNENYFSRLWDAIALTGKKYFMGEID